MLQSPKFEVNVTGTHSVIVPYTYAQPFIEDKHSRVALKAFYKGNTISFHGKLHKRNDEVLISFGKRYQKELGVTTSEYFQLQILENTTKYGVEMPEEFKAVIETDYEALQLFERLTDGKKRSLIYHIIRIKDTQKRVDRALLISENLKKGLTDLKLLTK